MAPNLFYENSNISNIALTPRDYQVEILSSANERNIITSLSQNSTKEFCALKLIQQLAHQLRRTNNRKISLFITSSPYAYNLIHYLTDLKVINLNDEENEDIVWDNIHENQVIIFQIEMCLFALDEELIDINDVNLLIIDDCHQSNRIPQISEIFHNHYRKAKEKPKIFGLAGPLHNAQCSPARLGAEMEYLESLMCAKVETASDIVTVLRYSSKPIEIIVECASPADNDIICYIRQQLIQEKNALMDHRYDPSEIYSDFKDELANIPDPKEEPLKVIEEFLLILNELGVYCADKAAFILLMHIEKLKIKTPHERHYLLLCQVSTLLTKIRAFIDSAFHDEENSEKEKIEKYSTPKIQRLLEVLKIFKPEMKQNNGPTNRSQNHRKEKEKEKPVDECESPRCLELISELNIENINTLETETSEKIKKISEDLENVKASVAKITSSSPSKQNNHRYNRFRGKKGRRFFHRPRYHHNQNEQEALCGLIFCESIVTAKTLFGLLCEVSRHDPDLKFLNVQYTVNKTADPVREPKECELEHRKQEEVLKKFRMHECNLLITTAILEEGFDLPKCNLVLRWNTPRTYRSYVQCKGRAKTANALHVIMINPEFKIQSFDIDNIADRNHKMICDSSRESFEEFFDCDSDSEPSSSAGTITEIENCVVEKVNELVRNDELYEEVEESSKQMIDKMAEYMEIEKMLIKHCENKEPHPSEIAHADKFTNLIQSYQPGPNSPQVTLATSIALLNKYCAKLPSDTFTKLTPIWRCSKSIRNGKEMFQYSLRLPLNSPMKNDIVGLPMPTRTLARRVACLIACRLLHKSGELDDNLSPIGKEGFKAIEPDWQFFDLDEEDEKVAGDENEPRPGTTKRRQYYYKRIASVFSNCRPTTEVTAYLYHITMVLQCPIPEEQNTRGRKIYPPEDAIQSFGILTTKRIPHISAFPIFTRSGEVKVSLELIKKGVTLNENQLNKINHFINYTFTNVLRLRKNLMLFDPEAVENSFFVVPVTRESGDIEIDWIFLTAIQHSAQTTSSNVNGKDRTVKPFDYNEFKDAVVMPWYRNLDQPQYFYVAEICSKLSPESDFPGDNYKTFDEYYFKKYNIEIKNKNQPLLDVDHTSARLNFLTPRYVNRKGVALPTSSEETKRAKRENLEQKQILVPELCTVHPFPASLWRAAVCLPCVLYRINALLLADEIRMTVSNDIGLGSLEIVDESFKWPMLDFGWTLADVLLKTREAKLKEEEESKLEEEKAKKEENAEKPKDEGKSEEKDDEENPEKSANDKLEEANDEAKWLDIGMWSNEMAKHVPDDFDDDGLLPDNLELCSSNRIRYGSPTSWEGTCEPRISKHNINSKKTTVANFYPSDSEFDSDEDPEDLPDFEEDDALGLNIEFKNDHLAEAVETEEEIERQQRKLEYLKESIAIEKYYEMMKNTTKGFDFIDEDNYSELEDKILIHEENFKKSITEAKDLIRSNGVLVPRNDKIPQKIRQSIKNESENTNGHDIEISELIPYADKNEIVNYLENDGQLSLDDLYEINAKYEERHPDEKFEIIGSGDLFDNFGDVDNLTVTDDCRKLVKLKIKNDYENFKKPAPESLDDKLKRIMNPVDVQLGLTKSKFSFDYQPNLKNHPGPSPSVILQALTMSNANDGINLERLETIGDSFLKYSITTYLYCTYESVNEGKLSYLRSKQVSNLNLYRLGRRKILGEFMIATKFEPHDNWLAPCYFVPKGLEQDLIDAKVS